MKAILTNYRQSPRKVALVAGLIRGKKVSDALVTLNFAVKRASNPIEKLLRSAVANAKNTGVANPENLYVTEIRVDKGIVLKRYMPRARGSSAQILKRSSNVILSLSDKAPRKMSKNAQKALKKSEGAIATTTPKAKKAAAKPKAKATKKAE